MQTGAPASSVHSVILAGGEGERLRPWLRERFGLDRPKQYCPLVGGATLLEAALDRAERISGSGRTTVVSARHHLSLAAPLLARRTPVRLLWQPADRGTAAGLFLALAALRSGDPDGVAVVLPADHFVADEERFAAAVCEAAGAAQRSDRLVLVGVRPDSADADYGYIRRAGPLAPALPGVQQVAEFVEKPAPPAAAALAEAGALWNTFAFAGRIEKFFELGRRLLPEQVAVFEELAPLLRRGDPGVALDIAYDWLEPADFSRHVLARAPEACAVHEVTGAGWSDWGRPERVLATARRFGLGLGGRAEAASAA